jgi:hypothetical protein
VQVRIFGFVNKLPALLLELDEKDRETVQLVRDLRERSSSVRDRSETQPLDAALEVVVVELARQVRGLAWRQQARMEMRMSHADLIGATLRIGDPRQLSLCLTGS